MAAAGDLDGDGLADVIAGSRSIDDTTLPGYARVYVYDPFGNRLELMEPEA